MSSRTSNPWLTFFEPNHSATLRLFCFPHAGGGASVYRSWVAPLAAAGIEVCAIQYPGRENRTKEPALRDLSQMIDGLVPALLPVVDKPFALFGHSMGALVSFEVIRTLSEKYRLRPEHVFFSGAGAPHTPAPKPIHHLPDREFLKELVKLNGIAPEVLASVELIRYILPVLRADFTLCETYQYRIGAPLPCLITAFGGDRDPRVERRRLEAWADHSSTYFSSRVFPGDHFYLRGSQAALLRAMINELQPLIDAAAA